MESSGTVEGTAFERGTREEGKRERQGAKGPAEGTIVEC
jgi:hypothetical protein